jgi:hypothetical protein
MMEWWNNGMAENGTIKKAKNFTVSLPSFSLGIRKK